MNDIQYMPFRFSDKESKRAHDVSVLDFLKCKNRYDLKPKLDDKGRAVSFNGHPVFLIYKDGTLLETRFVLDGVEQTDDMFFSAVDFLTEYEEYTPQAAITEVYLCIYGFPRDYLSKYGNKISPSSRIMEPEDLKYMSESQLSELRPRKVPIKDWENAPLDRKFLYISEFLSEEERDVIANRYNKKVPVSTNLNDFSRFVAPNPAKYCRHIEEFLIKQLNVSPEFVEWLIRKHLLYEDYGGNMIAPGFDTKGQIRFAYRRSCWLKSESKGVIDRIVDNSDPSYTWRYINRKADGLYLFEDILDAICYMNLMQLYSRASKDIHLNEMELHSFMYIGHLTGDTIPEWILDTIRTNINTRKIYICFQNDFDREQNYGQNAAKLLLDYLSTKNYHVENIIPDTCRSFTEFLTIYRNKLNGFISG